MTYAEKQAALAAKAEELYGVIYNAYMNDPEEDIAPYKELYLQRLERALDQWEAHLENNMALESSWERVKDVVSMVTSGSMVYSDCTTPQDFYWWAVTDATWCYGEKL